MIRVLLVTTWDQPCGIAEHSFYLKQAVEAADPGIRIDPDADALEPAGLDTDASIIHLNYQAALHSRWTPRTIEECQRQGYKVVCTYHDTGVPNSDQCKAIYEVADAFIVHEPCDDLPKALYWRMGVPAAPKGAYQFGAQTSDSAEGWLLKRYWNQPVLGSIGFPFPWKNYDKLAELTAECGWALVLIAPTATDEQIDKWRALNPCLMVRRDFVHRREALSILAGCDATAFCFTCANTGQSASILQGIATRKPVIALETCRQFRALHEEYPSSIHWITSFDQFTVGSLSFALKTMPIARVDARTVYIAEQESWAKLGKKYVELYRGLL